MRISVFSWISFVKGGNRKYLIYIYYFDDDLLLTSISFNNKYKNCCIINIVLILFEVLRCFKNIYYYDIHIRLFNSKVCLVFIDRPELEFIWAALMIDGGLENDYSPFALGDVGVDESEIREFQISVPLFVTFW